MGVTAPAGDRLVGLAGGAPARLGRRAALAMREAPFAAVRAFDDLAEAAPAWDRLEAVAAASPYQRRAWAQAWIETEGRATGVRPLILVAEDGAGRPLALVGLGLVRRGPLRVARFLGGRHANYNMALLDPAVTWTPADVAAMLRAGARTSRERIDALALAHLPLAWEGLANPLAALPLSQPSPSIGHWTPLEGDGAAFLRRHQSGSARKKLRAKANHLAALGPVAHAVAREPAAVEAALRAYLALKAAKLAAAGLRLGNEGRLLAFLTRAATPSPGQAAPLELHVLRCGEAIVAVFGGLAHRGRFSGLLIAHDTAPAVARCSPGELLLTAVLATKCADGFGSFDLGIGEARYKDSYCPQADPLVDAFLPLTARGHLAVRLTMLRLRVKAAIKASPRAWATVGTLRRVLGRRRAGAGAAA